MLVPRAEVNTIPGTQYSIQMAGGVPVITAPAEIDITTAGRLEAVLSDWRTRGHATAVVDMTGTRFCDSAGLAELARAHRQAVADGGGLRLVISADDAVLRVFTLIGLDHVIPQFASLEQGPGPDDCRRGPAFQPPSPDRGAWPGGSRGRGAWPGG
jgi:anti-sigma B factor antagonist